MKRRVFAVIIMMTLLTSMTLTATAESTTPETDLNTLGLLLNISKEEMAATLSREVGITMILKAIGFTQSDADLAASNSAFTDVPGWSKGWAELAYVRGITTGIGEGKFDPAAPMTQKQFLTFILRALEYDQSAAWENVAELSVAAGLIDEMTDDQTAAYTKKDASKVMYNALSAELQGKKVKLIDDLIERKVVEADAAKTVGLIETIPETAVPAGAPSAPATAPSAPSPTPPAPVTPTPPAPTPTPPTPGPPVSTFVLDSASAFGLKALKLTFSSDVDTFTVKSINGAAMAQSDGQDVSVIDGKEAVLIFNDPVAQNTNVRLTFDAKGKDGVLMTGQSVDVRIFDNEAPKIIRATAPNPYQVAVQYSEPVDYFVGSKIFEDVDALGLTVIKSELSKDLTTITFTMIDEFLPTSHGITIYDAKDFANMPAQPKKILFNVEWPSVHHTPELVLNLSDRSKAIAALDVNSNGDILVTFPEPITGFTPAAIKLRNWSDYWVHGKDIPINGIQLLDADKNKYLIDIADNAVNETDYALIIRYTAKDLATGTPFWQHAPRKITVPDLKSPTVLQKPTLINTSDGAVRIVFDEKMDSSTLQNLDNYLVRPADGAPEVLFSALTDAQVRVDPTRNSIDLISKHFTLGGSIKVQNIKDAHGNLLKYENVDDAITISAPMPFTMGDLKFFLKSPRSIEVVSSNNLLSDPIATINPFRLVQGDSTVLTGITIFALPADADSPHKMTLQLSKGLKTNATTDGATEIKVALSSNDIKDAYGSVLMGDSQALHDYVPPLAKIENIGADGFDIVFSEGLTSTISDKALLSGISVFDSASFEHIDLISGSNAMVFKGDARNAAKITVSNLKPNTEYNVSFSRWYIRDASPYENLMPHVFSSKIVTKSTTP